MNNSEVREPGSRVLAVVDRFSLVLAVIGGAIMAILAIQIMADVVARNVFGATIPGTLDLTSAVWMPAGISLGLAYALRMDEHLSVDLLTTNLSSRAERVIASLGMAVTLLAVGVLCWYTTENAVHVTELGEHALSARWLPIWPVSWVIVAGLIAFVLQAGAQLYRAVRGTDTGSAQYTVGVSEEML